MLDRNRKKAKDTLRKYLIKTSNPYKHALNRRWILLIVVCSFVSSLALSFLSQAVLSRVNLWIAFVILFLFILVGVFFDIIGLAVASGDEKPFHSMAAKKVRGAARAIALLRNAEKVSSICNDVIGDIVGIVSGMTIGVVVTHVSVQFDLKDTALVSLFLTGLAAALTIGGKAVGKTVAINQANTVVYAAARFLEAISGKKRKLH